MPCVPRLSLATSEDLSRSWAEASPCPMAPIAKDRINFHTLSVGHTTQGMRCIDAKVECTNPKLGDGAHYDVEVIRRTDAEMAEALDKGIRWVVLDWRLQYLYPVVFLAPVAISERF